MRSQLTRESGPAVPVRTAWVNPEFFSTFGIVPILGRRRVRPVLDRYTRQLSAQQGIVERARFLSPAILMQDALNDIAGTGAARHREFVNQVEVYHQRWREYFIPLVFQKARLEDYSGLPRSRL